MLSDPLVNPDKVSVPEVLDVKAIRSSLMTTVPVAGKDAESSKTILVDASVKAPSNVDSPTPNLIPLQSPNPQPAADSSTAGPIEY